MSVKEKPAVAAATEETPVDDGMVVPRFTAEEASLVLALITSGWQSAVLGSRHGYERLAAIEDKLLHAGAVPREVQS